MPKFTVRLTDIEWVDDAWNRLPRECECTVTASNFREAFEAAREALDEEHCDVIAFVGTITIAGCDGSTAY